MTTTRKPKPSLPSERDLENYGTQLLELDGWRSLKTDPVRNREWGKGFGELGMADRLYIRYKTNITKIPGLFLPWAEVLWIEWKRLKGKAADHQLNWIEIERARGALVWLADVDFEATPEAFYAHYKASGLMQKQISAPSGKA